jgi:hypothetical protein
MKMKWFVVLAVIVLAASLSLSAQNGKGPGKGKGTGTCTFIDENGDGINDNFRDHDGDGVPNHLDADWTRPQDGSGNKNRSGKGQGLRANRQTGGGNRFAEARKLGRGTSGGTGVCNGTSQNLGGGRRGRRG